MCVRACLICCLMCACGMQCVLNGMNMMTDQEVVNALPQCVYDGDSVSKSSWEQLFKTVKLIGKSMSIAAASRGPVTLILDRVKLLLFCVRLIAERFNIIRSFSLQ